MTPSYARIISCIESGANQIPSIAERAGMSIATVKARLHELKRFGIVRPVRLWNQTRSRCRHRRGEKYKRYLLIQSRPQQR